jgi:hypothetical protein
MKTMFFALVLSLASVSSAFGQTACQRNGTCGTQYGSVYRYPSGVVAAGLPPVTAGYQTVPGGGRAFSSPVRPVYTGFYGRYSPSAPLPVRRSR